MVGIYWIKIQVQNKVTSFPSNTDQVKYRVRVFCTTKATGLQKKMYVIPLSQVLGCRCSNFRKFFVGFQQNYVNASVKARLN